MKHPFLKMIRFEWKSNYMMWIMSLLTSVVFLFMFCAPIRQGMPFNPVFISFLLCIPSWLFTIRSYQESLKSQTMQGYHMIPISRRTKFLSKQFITFIAFPLVLYSLTFALLAVLEIFNTRPVIYNSSESLPPTFLFLFIIWILGHSMCTFIAIGLKNHKLFVAFILYLFYQITIPFVFDKIFGTTSTLSSFYTLTGNPLSVLPVFVLCLIPVILYVFSYRLFLRRQL